MIVTQQRLVSGKPFYGTTYDRPQYNVVKGIDLLNQSGVPSRHLMFYMLCGYNTSFQEDYERFELLDKLGTDPFVMRYNNHRTGHLTDFARWVNRRYYKAMSFDEYQKDRP